METKLFGLFFFFRKSGNPLILYLIIISHHELSNNIINTSIYFDGRFFILSKPFLIFDPLHSLNLVF